MTVVGSMPPPIDDVAADNATFIGVGLTGARAKSRVFPSGFM